MRVKQVDPCHSCGHDINLSRLTMATVILLSHKIAEAADPGE